VDVKVWRVKGNYRKDKTTLRFSRELIADKDEHARERTLSEIGSRHRVRRKDIEIKEVKEIRHEEITSLDIRRTLGLESGA
jgi:large subunit ribosomal protein LX